MLAAWIVAKLLILLARQRYARRLGPSYWESRLTGPQHAVVVRPFEPETGSVHRVGTVRVAGELWTARCPEALAGTLRVGGRVTVVPGEGMTLTVTAVADPPGAGEPPL